MSGDNGCGGHQEYLQIKPQADVVNVPYIVSEFFVPIQSVSPFDLGKTGNPGPCLMAATLRARISWQIFHQQWPWPNEAHFTAQNIEEFRQFIQTGGAEKTPQGCQPLFIGMAGRRAGLS